MKKRFLTIVSLVALLVLLASALPVAAVERQIDRMTTETFLADMDTFINAWAPDTSYGNAFNFSVRQSDVMKGLAQFDISSIPQYARVHEARLKLYATYRTNGSRLDLSAYKVLGPWDETVTWNTAAAADTTAAAMMTLDGVNRQVTLDVTDLAQSWVNDPASNFGLMFSAADKNRVQYTFIASEFSQESAGPPYPLLEVTYTPPVEMTILHTNDEHGWLETYQAYGSPLTEGGAANLMGRLTQNEGYAPEGDGFLLLSGGDMWTGPSISTWFEGKPMVEVMNAMGYDAAAIGNHEFDFGRDALNERLAEADFPFLAANIYYKDTTNLADFATPYVIKQVNGVDVGIIGLSTTSTPWTTHPKNITDLDFGDYEEALRREVPKMRAEGADLIIVNGHVCTGELATLAEAVGDLDIALMQGGHCHENFVGQANGTLIISAYWAMRAYGKTWLVLDPLTYDVMDFTQEVIPNEYVTDEGNPVLPDAQVEGIVTYWQGKTDEVMGQVIGYTETGMPRRSWKQLNYIMDSWLWAYGTADFAISNWGGFRAAIDAGDITVGDIVGVLPFENRIVDCAITGAQLVENLECCGGAVAGFSYTYTYADGQQIVDSVTLSDGSPLDMNATYHVLVNDFMYAGGDGYLFGVQDPFAYDTGIQWRQPTIDWTEAQGTTVDNPIEPLIDEQPRATEIFPLTILHTNDFHGYLETDYRGRGGSAYMASVINGVRDEVGADRVLLADAGDVYLGAAPISQLLLGESAIDVYNMLGYDVAAYGNHEFDKGQDVLAQRTAQSDFPWLGANIVLEGTEWDHADWVLPYVILDKGGVNIGVIGLDTDETPQVTLMGTTDGLVFKDLTETILHYYDEVMAQADALIVVAHMGTDNSGPYKGLQTVAQELIDAGKPVDLMIGGHQHQPLYDPLWVGDTAIIEAGYYGRWLGRADVIVDPETKSLQLQDYELITINNSLPADPDVEARVAYWADIVAPIVEQPIGTTNVSLVRDYNAESNMGNLVADSMLWKADQYDDGEVNGSVEIAFTNPGGLRADIEIPAGAPLPFEITWGHTFNVLPFANTLFLMDLTGEQIQTLLDQSANLYKGIMPTSGATWYWYNDCGCDAPTDWGAYGAMVGGEPLDPDRTYRVVTNNFLAPGGDGWTTFAEGANRWDTYYDMQEGANEYIQMYNATVGPIDHQVEGRIVKMDKLVSILHTNDTHGRWPEEYYRGAPQGLVFLASHIAAERAKNPNTILLDDGDTFQGNAFAQYFRNATPNPIAAGMNMLGYDAMTLGNHEFNFGRDTFATMLGQADFPILGSANLDDDGSYGFINENVQDYITLDVDGVKIAIFGLTNPEVPIYELPSNIPGLTFYEATATAAAMVPQIQATEDPDLLIALNHIGYDVYKDSTDKDKFIAQQIPGIDVIIGGHSHDKLDPAVMVTSDLNPDGTLIAQTAAYAQYLGKVNVGLAGNGAGGYDVVFREGYLLDSADVSMDAGMLAFLAPFEAELANYTQTEIGQTTAPLDALEAYTEETTGANVQADAAVYELTTNGIPVDFHLSGAMSNKKVADEATDANPVTLTVQDMYTLMPYENSLLVMQMNGPQIKAVLERGYRNYWYYKYQGAADPRWGGYSHYTTCMLDTDAGNVITYNDTYPAEPDGNNVVSLVIDGTPVDFADADTTYNVSSVNYVAAGSCNFNDDGVTLWPLDQIVADTQYYVRDAVIAYITAMGAISPAVEGRLVFQTTN
ncbi:MAG: 5'-nucleotidase C-terminal domain-containing protein [Chloroflexi bacterium]|nr:5'-nucleotidase C-terminal domain-containing protein [Chloroflexota bacterium]